jgi:hypothetical protein
MSRREEKRLCDARLARSIEKVTSQRLEIAGIIEFDTQHADKAWQSIIAHRDILYTIKNRPTLANVTGIQARPAETVGIDKDKLHIWKLLAP